MAHDHDTAPARSIPRRPALAPGAEPYRRDDEHLQIGIDPPQRVVLANLAPVRAALACLARQEWPPTDDAVGADALDQLERAHLIVDADHLALDRRECPAVAGAVYARHAEHSPAVLARRRQTRVCVVHHRSASAIDGHLDPSWTADLLHRAGVDVVATDDQADVALLLGDEHDLSQAADPWLRRGIPHLAVGSGTYSWQVGPFVAPGQTACLRCVEAHLRDEDPRRPVILAQRGTATVPDPAVEAMAVGWAVRDLVAWSEGTQPATWSTSYRVGLTAATAARTWTTHPWCGCDWQDDITGTG